MDEVIELVEPSLQAKGISLQKNYQSNPLIFGDAIQIQQVLINILNNAIDAITAIDAIATSTAGKPTNRIIRVGIAQNEQFAILTVQDSGPGITPNLLPTIFELYKTTKLHGLGVGLWLSKTIMDAHHGSITASNSHSGGAVFEIQIPLSQDRAH